MCGMYFFRPHSITDNYMHTQNGLDRSKALVFLHQSKRSSQQRVNKSTRPSIISQRVLRTAQ